MNVDVWEEVGDIGHNDPFADGSPGEAQATRVEIVPPVCWAVHLTVWCDLESPAKNGVV
jgi:hypothetical protein